MTMPKSILYDGWTDAWGDVDHSGDPNSGRIGCLCRWITHLRQREAQLSAELDAVRRSQDIALAAIDNFIAISKSVPAQAGE